MATLTLPPPAVPLVNKDGTMNAAWYRYFLELTRLINGAL